MGSYDSETYGERHADVYDHWYSSCEETTIATLAGLASGGRVLELGIGTGRIAIPLAMKGIDISGIDVSPAMVDKLHAKTAGKDIAVCIGNFADVSIEGVFSLIFVASGTFFVLLSQEEQVRCFRNAARHLTPNGIFLVEASVPDLSRYNDRQVTRASKVTADTVSLHVAIHDPGEQRINGQQIIIDQSGVRLFPAQFRYAWPSELDLMAQLAGLRLRNRWANWRGDPFISQSNNHVSVYERIPGE